MVISRLLPVPPDLRLKSQRKLYFTFNGGPVFNLESGLRVARCSRGRCAADISSPARGPQPAGRHRQVHPAWRRSGPRRVCSGPSPISAAPPSWVSRGAAFCRCARARLPSPADPGAGRPESGAEAEADRRGRPDASRPGPDGIWQGGQCQGRFRHCPEPRSDHAPADRRRLRPRRPLRRGAGQRLVSGHLWRRGPCRPARRQVPRASPRRPRPRQGARRLQRGAEALAWRAATARQTAAWCSCAKQPDRAIADYSTALKVSPAPGLVALRPRPGETEQGAKSEGRGRQPPPWRSRRGSRRKPGSTASKPELVTLPRPHRRPAARAQTPAGRRAGS